MLITLIVTIVFFHLLFLLALKQKDNSIADIGWGCSFVLVAVSLMLQRHSISAAQWLLLALVTAWGLRLSLHIGLRKRGQGEDFRYQAWRQQWGKHVIWRSYLQVFILQMIIMLVIALPLLIGLNTTLNSSLFTWIGTTICLIGLAIEIISDWQMQQFKANPANKGKIIQSGLWYYSRHPNYFGEACFWWGMTCIALPAHYGYLGLLGALVITLLLRFVSGVPPLEKKYMQRSDFQAYARMTPAMLPKWKRKN